MKRRLVIGIACALFAGSEVRAADHDDLYFEGTLGPKFERSSRSKIQVGGAAGYCPINSLGFGIGVDQAFALESGDSTRQATQIRFEARWFLEPFELAGGLGWQRTVDRAELASTNPMALGEVAYLWALTPSLAMKAEARAEFIFGAKSALFVGLGGRFLY